MSLTKRLNQKVNQVCNKTNKINNQMQYLPVSSAKWDQKEKNQFKTTQNLGPKYINTFTGQSQSPPKNTRYRKA